MAIDNMTSQSHLKIPRRTAVLLLGEVEAHGVESKWCDGEAGYLVIQLVQGLSRLFQAYGEASVADVCQNL